MINDNIFNIFSFLTFSFGYFLDPVGSLVSTLWVVGCGLLVGCHTFSKLVNFECVGVLVC